MNKTCLITGGSSGIGLELARQLAVQGYHVIIIGRDRQRLESARDELAKLGSVYAYSADVTRIDELQQVADVLAADGRRIDLLFVNAGIVGVDTVKDMPTWQMTSIVQTNLIGAMASAQVFLPQICANGRILFISSGFGLMGAAGYAAYCASKAGLGAFAESLRREIRRDGIMVQVACLPDIDTPQFRQEMLNKPAWMLRDGVRTKAMPVEVVCRRILAKCCGSHFYIFISTDVKALYYLSRILPRRLRDRLLDQLLPTPD